eukprot:FN606577.1.p1 GENE.FN606577.1~~FN606577.1.p1  ORF type:complete len:54 (+),score=10.32 FN606577.1:96-257(+)
MDTAARRRDLVLTYHEEFPGLGYISKIEGSFDWVPAPTEFLGSDVKTQCSTSD